jgi:hypothetical protein
MATFYVLSSRHVLGQRFSEMLSALFPGVRSTPWDWPELAELLAALVEDRTDAFIVYREDLDEARGVREALLRDFGAGADDQIVEIDVGLGLHTFATHFSQESRKAA